MQLTNRTKHLATAIAVLALFTVHAQAGPITATVFATGAPISSGIVTPLFTGGALLIGVPLVLRKRRGPAAI
jgi:Ni/Fe-hydrogenase subunit HybB-like protein